MCFLTANHRSLCLRNVTLAKISSCLKGHPCLLSQIRVLFQICNVCKKVVENALN